VAAYPRMRALSRPSNRAAIASSSPRAAIPKMPRDPIRMLARVARNRQRPMNPALLQERGALVDD